MRMIYSNISEIRSTMEQNRQLAYKSIYYKRDDKVANAIAQPHL
jgi:hypothetical protein